MIPGLSTPGMQQQMAVYRLKVNNVPPYLPVEEFRQLFSEMKGCLSANIVKDAVSGTQGGYLDFDSAENAETCVRLYSQWKGWGPKGLAFEDYGMVADIAYDQAAGMKRHLQDGGLGGVQKQPRLGAAVDVGDQQPQLSTDGLHNLLQLATASSQQTSIVPGLSQPISSAAPVYSQVRQLQTDASANGQTGYGQPQAQQQLQMVANQGVPGISNGMYQLQDGSQQVFMSMPITSLPQGVQLSPSPTQQVQYAGALQPQQVAPGAQQLPLGGAANPNQQQLLQGGQPGQPALQQPAATPTFTVVPGGAVAYVAQGQQPALQQPQMVYDARGNLVELPPSSAQIVLQNGTMLSSHMQQPLQLQQQGGGAKYTTLHAQGQPQTVQYQEPLDGRQGYQPQLQQVQQPQGVLQQPAMQNQGAVQPQFAQEVRIVEQQMPQGGAALQPQQPAQLPPNATPSLYIDNVPSDMAKRELSHIFRPFGGFKEVRIIHKPGHVFAFADFDNAECAAAALQCLNGYLYDPDNQKLGAMQLAFAREQTTPTAKPHPAPAAQVFQNGAAFNAGFGGAAGGREPVRVVEVQDRRPNAVARESPSAAREYGGARYGREAEAAAGRGGAPRDAVGYGGRGGGRHFDGPYGGRGGRDGGYGGRDGGYGGRGGRDGPYGSRGDRWQTPRREFVAGRGRGGYM